MHIVHFISSLSIGGAERILCSLTAYLQKTSHTQSVVYIHDGPIRAEIEALGIKTYTISGYFVRYDPLCIYACIKLFKSLKPDMIHSSLWAANMLGIMMSWMIGIPIVCAIHAQRSVEGRIRNTLDRYILHYAHHITTITHTIKNQLLSDVKILPTSITVIENGIDIKKITELAQKSTITRADLRLKKSDFIIGSVGRLVKEKEYPFLLTSVAHLLRNYDHMHLILIGIGPELATLKALAHELDIQHKVHFIVGQMAINYYHLFDCFVLPSTCEALSLVLLEAMALKIPCIVRGNHYREIIEHTKEAYIIDNEQALEEAIILFSKNSVLAKKIGLQAYALIATSYIENNMLSSYQQSFELCKNNYYANV